LYRYKEFDQLVEKEVDPLNYIDGPRFRDDFAAVSFLRKNSSLQTSFNKKAAALDTFNQAEEICKDVNERLRNQASRDELTVGDYAVLKDNAGK
jgi:hypothetical protein